MRPLRYESGPFTTGLGMLASETQYTYPKLTQVQGDEMAVVQNDGDMQFHHRLRALQGSRRTPQSPTSDYTSVVRPP